MKKPEFLHVNTLWFYLSLAMIALGFLLMFIDGEPYGFGFMGLTLGAGVALVGFILPLLAIMLPKKDSQPNA